MFDGSKHNPRGRFDGLGGIYARYRPDYPALAIDWIVSALPTHALIADVGAGTGILTRQLAERGLHIIGIEPNESMRSEASAGRSAIIEIRAGNAEATGLADASVDGVVAGQAFHWFDREAALREFHRILRPEGTIALIWNIADDSDPLTLGFWRLMQATSTDADVVRETHDTTGRILLDHPHFKQATVRTTTHHQIVDEESLIGRAFSASFAPKDCRDSQILADRLRQLIREHSTAESAALRYRTVVYQAIRKD